MSHIPSLKLSFLSCLMFLYRWCVFSSAVLLSLCFSVWHACMNEITFACTDNEIGSCSHTRQEVESSDFLAIGPALRILQLNVEGLFVAKHSAALAK